MDSVVSAPVASGDFAADAAHFSAYWLEAKERLARLGPRPKRDPAAFETAEALKQAARDARFVFLRRHARTLYDRLTNAQAKFVRIERLAYDAAEMVPGLVPTSAEVAAEAELRQADKDGCEIDQGILFNQFLADPVVRPASLPRHAAAARGIDRGAGQVPARRKARSRLRQGRAPGQGGHAAPGQQALPQLRGQFDPARHRDRGRRLHPRPAKPGRRAARRGRARGQVCRPPHLQCRHQPHAPLLRQDPVPVVPGPRPGLREQDDARARQARGAARRGRGRFDREALDLGGGNLRHRRRLPDPAGDRLQHRRPRRLPDPAGAQGRHHPGDGEPPAARASSATASPARRSCTSAASTAIPRSAA